MTASHNQSQETLIARYRQEIEEILTESEHVYRLTIDYDLLEQKVTELLNDARQNGIEEKVIWNLLQARIPSYVNFINHKSMGKKAA